MQLSEWLISVFVPFLQIYIGAHVPVKRVWRRQWCRQSRAATTETQWAWFARILFWKAEKGNPDAVGGFLGTDHVMSVYHTPWTRLFPLKPFDTSDVPPFTGQSRDDGLLPSLSHVVLFFLCAHWGFGRDYSSHTVRSVFITEILHDFAFFFWKAKLNTFKNLVHEFAEHQAEVWLPGCNINIETVGNGPKYICMFRKTFRQLVESNQCH